MMKPFLTKFSISAGACIGSCLILLLLPAKIILSIFAAVTIHELCHIVMLKLIRIPIYRIEVNFSGAEIHTGPLLPWQELLCAAAGPAGSFLCLLFVHFAPVLALCGLIQGIYNLLPILPLDGGRMLRSTCLCFFPQYARKVCLIGKCFACVAVLFICAYLFWHTKDYFYIAAALYFLLQTLRKEKSLAKSGDIEYNGIDF